MRNRKKLKGRDDHRDPATGESVGVVGASDGSSAPTDQVSGGSGTSSLLGRIADEELTPAAWLLWLRTKLVTERVAVLVVLAFGALMFLPYLGTLGLWDCWEPHYAEVAREMIVRDDYLHPHWESAYFFSKPALTLWLIALGLGLSGTEGAPAGEPLGSLAAWGARLPIAFIAIFALWAVYRIGRQIKDRATGFLAVLILGTCPQFIFIGKQAMTDMPLVGFLTAGLAFFLAAVFEDDEVQPSEWSLRTMRILGALAIAFALFPQLFVIGREYPWPSLGLVAILGTGALGFGYILFLLTKGRRRDAYLVGFYVCEALAVLAKGPAALMVLAVTLIPYLVFSGDWGLLTRSRVLLGSGLFLLIAAPWYVAMALFKGRDDEGKTFVDRFFIHDTFARIGQGVHGDRADLGYFIEQLVYGMFPWAAAIPPAIGLAARWPEQEADVRRRRAVLFVLIWAVGSYVAFSFSQTKFHHYIFPAVPALAILIALWFTWVSESPSARLKDNLMLLLLAVFVVGARDLISDPQLFVNLFTYKYDRDYPRELHPRAFLVPAVVVGGMAVALLYTVRKKGWAMGAFLAVGLCFGLWISHVHFNFLSPHWSQAHLFKTYYSEKLGNEPIYAYQLNWRGETFYSRNTILQVKEAGANQKIRELVDRPGREFIITEQSRFQTLRNALSPDKRDKIKILDRSNNKFYLCVVED